jgi:hypothetical protein
MGDPMWRARPVFISSTFLDMQAERDHLRTHVFPALEERLKARRHFLEWVDLRLGVAAARQTLRTLARGWLRQLPRRAEVKRCRPFLIVPRFVSECYALIEQVARFDRWFVRRDRWAARGTTLVTPSPVAHALCIVAYWKRLAAPSRA